MKIFRPMYATLDYSCIEFSLVKRSKISAVDYDAKKAIIIIDELATDCTATQLARRSNAVIK